MADLSVSGNPRIVFPRRAEVWDGIAAEALTAGDVLYPVSGGTFGLADANDSGKEQAVGIALFDTAAGEAVSILSRGHVAGFDLSGVDHGDFIYLSDTAKKLADAAGTLSVTVGRVWSISDKPNYTKTLYLDFQITTLFA
ncbi:MAG: hypothetical protein JRE40_00085 [Deltaproteobacteria bacterium]|nr:hypothetical protein [Deltaproteobacteria bacterium]